MADTVEDEHSETPILREGETCWRLEHAGRASVLVDGAAYFGALRKALLAAERSVFVIGWDIDSRTEIRGEEEPDDDAPLRLGELLTWLVERRPGLEMHLLLWDYSVIYALEREPVPSISLDWATPERIAVCLDDVVPLGASHHQKVVVVDDALAFCGGLDLTIRRWDTSSHRAGEPARKDPSGEPYPPFHDVQMCVDGDAARGLAELVRDRWREAACEEPMPIAPADDRWPEGLAPDFEDVEVGIARTLPALNRSPAVHEVEALFLAAIGEARRWIYIENQYLTADCIAVALERRLAEVPGLEVAVVVPRSHSGWLEHSAMQVGRYRFVKRLQAAGVADRLRLFAPVVEACGGQGSAGGEQTVMVHAKVMIVDDRFLRVGSSNLNNRSMGLDTECDLALEAADEDQARAIARVRHRLLAEHLGASERAVAETLERDGSLFRAIEQLSGEGRGLREVRDDADEVEEAMLPHINQIADPERPIESGSFIGDMFGGQPAGPILGRTGKLLIVGVVLVALALAWRFTPLHELTDPDTIGKSLEGLARSAWAPVVVPLAYVVAGLLVFPITVLITATAMVFDPLLGLGYAVVGALLSASATYGVGAAVGRDFARRVMGRRINRISRALARRGVVSVAALRMVPIAPFTLVNLVAGVSHVRFRDYLLGTALGMAPGIAVMTALGSQLRELLVDPSPTELGIFAACVLAWLALAFGLQILVPRLGHSSQ